MSANKYLSYTYLIGWSNLDLWYYGVRWRNIRLKRTPEEDLWIYYFTHSKPVKHMRAFIGEPDVIHIDKTFNSIDKARKYESKVLIEHNAKKSPHWLNKHDRIGQPIMIGKDNPMYGKKIWLGKNHTEESKNEMRKSKTGPKNSNYGKPAHNRKKVLYNGKIYNSREEASKELNVNIATIYKWLKKGKAMSL